MLRACLKPNRPGCSPSSTSTSRAPLLADRYPDLHRFFGHAWARSHRMAESDSGPCMDERIWNGLPHTPANTGGRPPTEPSPPAQVARRFLAAKAEGADSGVSGISPFSRPPSGLYAVFGSRLDAGRLPGNGVCDPMPGRPSSRFRSHRSRRAGSGP